MSDRREEGRTARDKLLAKVRAMLAKAENNPSAEEAATAAAMAAKWMQQHNIDFADVQVTELEAGEGIGSEWVYANINKGKARDVSKWAQWLAVGVSTFYECKCRIAPGEIQVTADRREPAKGIQFVGYELDVKVCAWLYQYVFKAVVNQSILFAMQLQDKGIKANDMKPHLRKFREFAALVICARLRTMKAEQDEVARQNSALNALVLLKSDKIEDLYGEFKVEQDDYKPDFRSSAAMAGAMAGERIDLNVRGVHDNAERPQQVGHG